MASFLPKTTTHRRIVRALLATLLTAACFAVSPPAFAAPDRAAQIRTYDEVYHFIRKVKGKTTAHRYTTQIVRSAQKHGLSPLLVANLILSESSFNPRAISPKGAIGLMQVMPFHYRHRRIPVAKWHDPATNIDLGCEIYASYLAMMDKRYPDLSPEALQHRALVAYNMGPRAVISRGIYRSRYSQAILQRTAQPVPAPPPAVPQPLPEPPPPAAESEPVLALAPSVPPVRWAELPLTRSDLSVAPAGRQQDPLRIGYPLPETFIATSPVGPDSLASTAFERGTP